MWPRPRSRSRGCRWRLELCSLASRSRFSSCAHCACRRARATAGWWRDDRGAAVAAALTLLCGSGQTHPLVQSAEKLAHVEQLDFRRKVSCIAGWGALSGGLAGQVIDRVVNLEVKHDPPPMPRLQFRRTTQRGRRHRQGDANADDADDDDDDRPGQRPGPRQGRHQHRRLIIAPRAPAPGAPPAPSCSVARLSRRWLPSLHLRRLAGRTSTDQRARARCPERGDPPQHRQRGRVVADVGGRRPRQDRRRLRRCSSPTEALRTVLLKANCMGVLRGDKLAVMAAGTGGGHSAGLLVEQRGDGQRQPRSRSGHRSADLVKVGGDLVIPSGTMVKGNAVAVLGSVEVGPGAVVQGDGGGDRRQRHRAAGRHRDGRQRRGVRRERGRKGRAGPRRISVQVGIGPLFSASLARHRSFLSRIGPFGLFPTLALFAIVYLLGLLALAPLARADARGRRDAGREPAALVRDRLPLLAAVLAGA